jgi:uncharacterized phage protein (TIGR02218 family)
MLILNPDAIAHFAQECTRLTVCGIVTKKNGQTIRCTQFDDDIEIEGGDFEGIYMSTAAITASAIKSSSDLSADNLEVTGALADAGFQITGFNVDDIVAGQFRNAPFEIFICQWDNPSAWQKVIHRGYLGQITRTAEGAFTAEWRGLLQVLAQNVGRTYGETCDVVRYCDSRCKLDPDDWTFNATVTAVVNRRSFTLDITGLPLGAGHGLFDTGDVTLTNGENIDYTKQVKRDSVDGIFGKIELWESFPKNILVGATATIFAGCDRRFETCQQRDNVVNFRGHGRWMPGTAKIIRAPG